MSEQPIVRVPVAITDEQLGMVLGTVIHSLLGEISTSRSDYDRREARIARELADLSDLDAPAGVKAALLSTASWLGHKA